MKLLEYLSCGLPVVTTPFGARGVEAEDGVHLLVRGIEAFPETIRELAGDPERRGALGAAGRELVVARRSWERIAGRRRELLGGLG